MNNKNLFMACNSTPVERKILKNDTLEQVNNSHGRRKRGKEIINSSIEGAPLVCS